jgi:hypothetical protein
MTDDAQGMARPASVEDLKLLLGALHDKDRLDRLILERALGGGKGG